MTSTWVASTSGSVASWSLSLWWGCWITWWVHRHRNETICTFDTNTLAGKEHTSVYHKVSGTYNDHTWSGIWAHLFITYTCGRFGKCLRSRSVGASLIACLPRVTIPVSLSHIPHFSSSPSFVCSLPPAESLPLNSPRLYAAHPFVLPCRPSFLSHLLNAAFVSDKLSVSVQEPRRRDDDKENLN